MLPGYRDARPPPGSLPRPEQPSRTGAAPGHGTGRLGGLGGKVRNVTVKLVVLYASPSDPDAFDRHYLGTHVPLVHAIPGLQRFESGPIATYLDGGEKTYYRVAELYFADQQAVDAAFGSDEGKATAADYQQIAPPGSRMFVQTVDE